MDAPAWSFLVESSTGRKVLFDLGVGKSDDCRTPDMRKQLEELKAELIVEKDTAEILEENGVPRDEIESVIWRSVARSDPTQYPPVLVLC